MKKLLQPNDWHLSTNSNHEICVGTISTVAIAAKFGTPTHVVNIESLKRTIGQFTGSFSSHYRGPVSIHFAFKSNTVPGILKIIKAGGIKAEIMSEFELDMALKLNYRGNDIIVNGPYKPIGFLEKCMLSETRFIVIDSISEIYRLNDLAIRMKKTVSILFRINPDYIPKGMNYGTATGSRKGCAFGLDMKSGEVMKALDLVGQMDRLRFMGFHFHMGSGIHYPSDFRKVIHSLRPLIIETRSKGHEIKILDIGGGIGSFTSREMTTFEMLQYQAIEQLPKLSGKHAVTTFESFAVEISTAMHTVFKDQPFPELVLEPGRCIVSSNQFLLLTVHDIKDRKGVGKWIITDGGIGTVTMPTYYECHEILLCNDLNRKIKQKVTIIGPVCFAGDIVYRNKPMPELYPGEILAVMDSGAYFTNWETSFGFPRSAIVAVDQHRPSLIRRRENFNDMIIRDQT